MAARLPKKPSARHCLTICSRLVDPGCAATYSFAIVTISRIAMYCGLRPFVASACLTALNASRASADRHAHTCAKRRGLCGIVVWCD